ncbi:uncharacterized protein L199_000007 [Kwoniella botswanensis]|uniref:uncharacterized protein n=1 Tax=Kwoniella botswanensis TaxID=1268659 RepID=UPI00315CDB65
MSQSATPPPSTNDPPCELCETLKIACVSHSANCEMCTKRHRTCSLNEKPRKNKKRKKSDSEIPTKLETLKTDIRKKLKRLAGDNETLKAKVEMIGPDIDDQIDEIVEAVKAELGE